MRTYFRVCSCGCKRPLKKTDGSPDYRRRFFSEDCKNSDAAAKRGGSKPRG